MLQKLAGELESRLGRDRASNFRGTALIKFEHLEFDHKSNKAKTRRLVKIMRLEGCLKVEPLNRIKAYIRDEHLDQAISRSGITQHELFNNQNGIPPTLKFPEGSRVSCDKGASRIEAARGVLCSEDHEWAIELYLKDTTAELRKVCTNRTLNDGPLEDLEIYFNIRQAQSERDELAEGRWRVRLPEFKRRYLNQFLKHERLVAAFDRVVRMPGQRFGMTMSTIHDFLGSKCHEEILYYLQRTDRQWSSVFEYDEELICQVDRDTVEAVQCRAPARSPIDREYLQTLVKGRDILTFVADDGIKERILENFLQIESLIPSMQSLGQDAKVLEFHAKCLTGLFGDSEESLRSRLQQSFKGTNQRSGYFRVQQSEFVLREYEGGVDEQLNFGIAQLWLFLGRHFSRDVKQNPQNESPIIWHRFATLAYQLGFESPRIHELVSEDAEEKSAGAWLLEARPSPEYEYNTHQFERFKKQMAHMVAQAREVSLPDDSSQAGLNRDEESLQRRCSRALENFECNRHHLFLTSFFEHSSVTGDASSLFVALSRYKAFLGYLLEPNTVGRQGAQGGLGAPGSLIIPLSKAQIREDSAGPEAEEIRGRSGAEERGSTYPRHHSFEGHVTSDADSQLTLQVTNLQIEIQQLQQHLQAQKRCNEELLEHATDGRTRERRLEEQAQALETKLARCEELKEQRLAEQLQKTNAVEDEGRKGVHEAEHRIKVVEAELQQAFHHLHSITSERDQLIGVSRKQTGQINALEQQNNERQATLNQIRSKAMTESATLIKEIAALKSENDDLRMKCNSQTVKLEDFEHTNKELHDATKDQKKTELRAKNQENDEAPMKLDVVNTKRRKSPKTETTSSSDFGREDRRQHDRPSSQEPPPRSMGIDFQDKVAIHFEFQEDDGSRAHKRTQKMTRAELKRVLQKGHRKGVYPMTRAGRALDPETAWDDIVNDETCTIVEARMSKAAFLDEASLPAAAAAEAHKKAQTFEHVRDPGAASLQHVGRETRPRGNISHAQRATIDSNNHRDGTYQPSEHIGGKLLNQHKRRSFSGSPRQLGKGRRP